MKKSKGEGFVSLVGAGPGDPGLLTMKGAECIRGAEVIVCDHLVSPEIKKMFPKSAHVVDAGKEGAKHTLEQNEIEAEIVKYAKRGHYVVRLKGGDPFVFGRGGEECATLVKAGIPYEVVPGITSAIGGPAYAGIPVLHRDYSDTLAIVTGHRREGKGPESISVPDTKTIVFLMGVKNLEAISKKCIEKGFSPSTPVALIQNATTPRQRVVTGTLSNILTVAKSARIRPPALLVVGDVVKCHDQIAWFKPKPLLGKKVIVTRSRSQASALSSQLEENGATAVEVPVIQFQDLTRKNAAFDHAIKNLGSFDWIIFTSANGVDFFLKAISGKKELLAKMRKVCLAVVGPGTAEVLKKWGLKTALTPKAFVAEGLLEALPKDLKGKRILIPKAQDTRDILEKTLAKRGAEVSAVSVYKTIPARVNTKLLTGANYITFTSSSTVENFCNQAKVPAGCRVVCIGPITAATAKEHGLSIDVLSENATIGLLVEAIIKDTYDIHK